MVNLTINGKEARVPEDTTILQAAQALNIKIPSLCHLKDVNACGVCRICVVEVAGSRNLQASCITKVREGMVVQTSTPRVRSARRTLYELMLSDHPKDCLNCSRSKKCELQELGELLGVDESRFEGEQSASGIDVSPSVTRDPSKCILCRRCVTVCGEIQQVGAIGLQNRGFNTLVSPSMGLPLDSTACAMCGQCVAVCPTGALSETDALAAVWKALGDPAKRVVVQVAPAVRAALGEEFGYPVGTAVTGRMASALRELGFDDVFDTNFAADLTIIEEGTELLGRLTAAVTGGHPAPHARQTDAAQRFESDVSKGNDSHQTSDSAVLPMITSCSPGWIKHIEHAYPEELDHLSTCKSPHTMLGALAKSFYAEKIGADPKDLYVVSVMPCTAKKYEIRRPEMGKDGLPDVDAVLTTRELARMIRQAGIDFDALPEGDFDTPLGLSSGAADIFGVTGGVTEAALRTVYELVTGRELPFDKLHVTPLMGMEQVKTAEVTIESALPDYAAFEGVTVKIAVTSGLAGADILLDAIASGNSPYHFIEVMGCPGGCINGGGQPRSQREENYREKRAAALYGEDEGKPLRKSHENPAITALYEEYLGEVGGELAHELLHTHYVPRGLYNQLTAQAAQ